MVLEQFFTFLVSNFWWLGVFLLGLISSATLFLPAPGFVVIYALGTTYNPFVLGAIGGLGSAIGEFTGYYIGYGVDKFYIKRRGKRFKERLISISKSFQRYHPSLVLFFFSFTPVPFDVAGLFCGIIKYPKEKFFIPVLIGKVAKYTLIALAGFYSVDIVLRIMGH